MQPRRAGAIWSNEDASLAPAAATLKGKKGLREGAAPHRKAQEASAPAEEPAAAHRSGTRQKGLKKQTTRANGAAGSAEGEHNAAMSKKLSRGRKEGEQAAPAGKNYVL